ncbi:auxin-responsive protein IAA1-like [Aristolochia californica]|uniref:auxin-responsive protein IAA1-like n=1 Tax=Aristolochia californica TaxID=171875 RepID=UPI0035DD7715
MASLFRATDPSCLNLEETELTLGLPGGLRTSATSTDGKIGGKTGGKRGFCETIDFNLGTSGVEAIDKDSSDRSKSLDNGDSTAGKPSAAKAQVVGWPPVRSLRKNVVKSGCKYVKVAVDGAPYLRKVDLEMYRSYQELLNALEEMFSCLTIRRSLCESKLMDTVNGTEYVPTYEDKDGDWMLVGDVPWKMFVESCKRLRLMKSSEAAGLAPRTPERCGYST